MKLLSEVTGKDWASKWRDDPNHGIDIVTETAALQGVCGVGYPLLGPHRNSDHWLIYNYKCGNLHCAAYSSLLLDIVVSGRSPPIPYTKLMERYRPG
jgi:hypothetical protein